MLYGCSDDDDSMRGMQTIEMPVSITIPAEGFVNPNDIATGDDTATGGDDKTRAAGSMTRAMGDPGTAETFSLPRFLYIYIVSEDNDGETRILYQQITVNADEWKLSTSIDNGIGNDHFSAKDGLYVYQGHITVALPIKRKEGRVYAVASNVDMTESKINLVTSHTWTSEEAFVNAITFTNDGSARNNLQNIYSSPYNKTKDCKYYGEIKDYTSNVPHIDMVLYHVATKVDLTWTIDEEYQGTAQWPQVPTDKNTSSHTMRSTTDSSSDNYNRIFFSYIEARKLPKNNIKVFAPMGMDGNNYSGSTFDLAFHGTEMKTGNMQSYTSGGTTKQRDEYYQVMPDGDKAAMYYGRKVIYAVPLRYANSGDYFITLRVLVNNYTTSKYTDGTYTSLLTTEDHATAGYHTYIRIKDEDMAVSDKDSDGNPIYTPWIRATLHVKSTTDVGNIVKFNDPKDYTTL